MDREEKPEVVPGLRFFIISTMVLIMTRIYPVYYFLFFLSLMSFLFFHFAFSDFLWALMALYNKNPTLSSHILNILFLKTSFSHVYPINKPSLPTSHMAPKHASSPVVSPPLDNLTIPLYERPELSPKWG